jgi:hypothetical protein
MANNDFSTLGGAYSILGQATTSEYNRRKKEEQAYRRKMRRQQMLQYLAAPLLKSAGESIVGAITKPFEDKYNDFFTSENVVKERALWQAANRKATDIEVEEKKARDYVNGYDAYWTDTRIAMAKEGAIRAQPERQGEFESGWQRPYFAEKGKDMGLRDRAAHEKALGIATDFRATGTFKENIGNRRSRSAVDRFIDLFQREGVEEQDAKALAAYRKTEASKNAKRLNVFEDALVEGPKGMTKQKAYEIALNNVPKTGKYGEDFTITEMIIDHTGEYGPVGREVTKVYNKNSESWKKNGGHIRIESTIKYDDPKKFKQALIEKALKDSATAFPIATLQKGFNEKGHKLFTEKAEAEGINWLKPETLEERAKLEEIFTDIYSDRDNLTERIDPKDTQRMATMGAIMANNAAYAQNRAFLEEAKRDNLEITDPPAYQALLDTQERLELIMIKDWASVAALVKQGLGMGFGGT